MTGVNRAGEGDKEKEIKTESLGAAAPLPPVGGNPGFPQPQTFTDAQARALALAGRLLQNPSRPGGKVKIEKMEGESYPAAVARVVADLDPAERQHLRELVAWVMDYEAAEATPRPPQRAHQT